MKVLSPVTHSGNVMLINEIDTTTIVRRYKQEYGLDVSKYFSAIPAISVYECKDTKYRFFYPFNIAGDDLFYEELQQFDWYYMPWKWEHARVAEELNRPNLKVLEIGSAKGAFLEKIRDDKGAVCSGIEINTKAAEAARQKGLDISTEYLSEYAAKHTEEFDLVCFFQVLEHVYDIHGFVSDAVKCLKPGGKLAIGVPNNSSFIKLDETYQSLNMPPHHMGLWDETSLRNIAPLFGLKVDKVLLEPTPDFNRVWKRSILHSYHMRNKPEQSLLEKLMPGAIVRKLDHIAVNKLEEQYPEGQGILVTYTKGA